MPLPAPSTRCPRRAVLAAAALPLSHPLRAKAAPPRRLFFTSRGKTGLVNEDGSGLRYLNLRAPRQVTWQPGPFLPDGRVIFLSMEERRDGPGRPFDEYYHLTPTRLWLYHPDREALDEICTRDRLAPFITPQLVLSPERLLIQVIRRGVGQVYSVNLDGSDPREFTRAGDGLPYGLSLSPDGRRVAYHLASPEGYQVWTCDPDGGNRVRVAAAPGHLYFGTAWSPDGHWVLYADCLHREDPGHDWADVCIGRPDGTEHRVLTEGQSMWFAATYGPPGNHGGGSNVPAWTPDGAIIFPRRLPGSKVPWEYRQDRRDVDHFNRDFRPEGARGGVGLCRLDPRTGKVQMLTTARAGLWDFRATPSRDGARLAFCRADTGGSPGIWVAGASGRHPRLLTRGLDERGADHPRWLPRPA